MLKKIYRSLDRKTIQKIQRKGETFGNRFFKAWSETKDSGEGPVQFALIISKKVSKKAVIRNKLRRQIYEIIRTHYTSWENPRYIIISVKNVCSEATFEEIEENLMHLLQQIPISNPS